MNQSDPEAVTATPHDGSFTGIAQTAIDDLKRGPDGRTIIILDQITNRTMLRAMVKC